MKSLRNIAFSALLTIGAFGAMTYTSCNTDNCKNVVCSNGGLCNSTDGTCSCPTGYTGATCGTLVRDQFVGVYTGAENCTSGTDNYTITISANSDNLKITLTNIYNQSFTGIGTVSGSSANSFTFTGAQGSTNFSGTGTLSGNQLTLIYSISSASASNSCTFIGNK